MRKSLHLEMDLTLEPRFTKEFVVKKNDDITLDIALKNDRLPVVADNQVARLFVRKQDGSVIVQGGTEELGDGSIVIGGNVVRIHLKNSATNTTGLCYAELELQDESGVMATHSFIFEVIDRLDNIDEAIKATDDIYILKELEEFIIQAKKDIAEIREVLNELKANMEQAVEDFNNAIKDFEEKLEGTNADIDEKVAHFEKLTAELEDRIGNFENAYKNAEEELALIKEEAIVDIDNLRKWSLTELEDYYNNCVDSLTLHYKNFYASLRGHASELKLELDRERDKMLTVLETAKNDAIAQITSLFNQYMIDMDIFFESCLGEIEEKMGQALRNISDATESSLEAIQDKADDIIEQINNIEIGSIEGVNQAVEEAEKRLQELSVQESWNVSQTAREEEEKLIASLGQKANELRDGLKATTDNHIENINEAGQNIISAVENLEANIEQGLTDINNAINTGKTEISEISQNYLDRIETEGEEIVQAVANLEITTAEQIKQINTVGMNNIQSINSVGSSKKTELRNYTNELKEDINELTENKKEEINNILGVSKGEVEELLETTRSEINAHRTNINEAVSEGINNINSLKGSSISEMTTVKDNLLEELLGAEVELEKDFEALHQEIIADINNVGDNKTEALNNLIERINALELEIERNLQLSDKKAENLEKTLENVDNKIEEISPVLDGLDELRSLCNELIAQNEIASNSLQDLEYWTLEADVRIVELRRLCDLAKQYEEVVQRWIDARGGNHEEIEARLHALEESVIALDDTIAQLENLYATKEELLNYATKEELDDLKKNSGLRVVGKIGTGFKTAKDFTPETMKGNEIPAELFEPYGDVKHTLIARIYSSSTYYYAKFFFFVDLNDTENGKYVYLNSGKTALMLDKLEYRKDYQMAIVTKTATAKPTSFSSSYYSSINVGSYHGALYDFDFNIYDIDKNIVIEAPGGNGISNLNDCVEEGYYTINVDFEGFSSLQNAPTLNVKADEIKGYLKVVGDIQTISLSNGEVFTRAKGGAWKSSTANSVKEDLKGIVGNSSTIIAPAILKSTPGDVHYFLNRDSKKEIIFRMNENEYCILRYSYNSNLSAYFNSNMTYIYIKTAYYGEYYTSCIYNAKTGVWTGNDNISNKEISFAINADYFEIYKTDFAVYTTSNSSIKYQDVTELTFDGLKAFDDFNNALEAGTYEVNVDGVIANSPAKAIKGILNVITTDNEVYQELKANDNITVYSRVLNGSKWSEWTETGGGYVGTVGLSLKASVDKQNIFNDVPEPPKMPGHEYVGKFVYSYLNSSNQYYTCTYIYRDKETKATPYISATEKTSSNGNYYSIYGYDFTSSNSATYRKYATDTEWSKTYGVSSFSDYSTTHIYHNDVVIYTGGANKDGIYREAMNADIIGDLDNCKKAGKYFINVSKNEYDQIQNMPPTKIEKDLEATLYVNINGDRTLQEITIEGITYTRKIGEKWTGINNSFVKNDVLAHIEGIEVNATDYEIETANIEDIYASCPVLSNHKTPTGTMDFKDSSGKYYRWIVYGEGSGFFFTSNSTGSTKHIGCYAYNPGMSERYVYNGTVWSEHTNIYASVGRDGDVLACDLDVCGGTSHSDIDKTIIVRKADVKTDIKVINDFNEANKEGRYIVNIEENKEVLNAPKTGLLSGTLEVIKVDDMVKQLFTDNTGEYTRVFNEEWSEWTTNTSGLDEETSNKINDLLIPNNEKINTVSITNEDGMPESYSWIDMNGFKVMWIDVKLSEEEYNLGASGLIMKTLNIPEEAQVFNSIINANITSYCRSSNDTLSRIVQNAEVISNTSVRGRWRHTDNTYPRIDRFTIICFGF